jgi:hypothetical protein
VQNLCFSFNTQVYIVFFCTIVVTLWIILLFFKLKFQLLLISVYLVNGKMDICGLFNQYYLLLI